MEDALVLGRDGDVDIYRGLNPCCNGRCTRTQSALGVLVCRPCVLILVVMEDALVLTKEGEKACEQVES